MVFGKNKQRYTWLLPLKANAHYLPNKIRIYQRSIIHIYISKYPNIHLIIHAKKNQPLHATNSMMHTVLVNVSCTVTWGNVLPTWFPNLQLECEINIGNTASQWLLPASPPTAAVPSRRSPPRYESAGNWDAPSRQMIAEHTSIPTTQTQTQTRWMNSKQAIKQATQLSQSYYQSHK